MAVDISDTLISRLSHFINSRTGLYFPREKWRDLRRNILAAAPDLGFADPEQCIRWILSGGLTAEQADIIVAHLTIGETFFFRDHGVFAALKDHVLTPWAQSRKGSQRRLRFWSAACSSGEEPYSIAILLDQMKELFRGWEITILGTDINARFLEKAKEGVYTQWSFRNMPEGIMPRYFTQVGRNRFEISPHIKNMVTFSRLNLIEEGPTVVPAPNGNMDVILCRNALMYLSADMRLRVIHRLINSLAEDGWLIVSPAETSLVEVPTLRPTPFPGAVFHRKIPPRRVEKKTIETPGHPLTHGRRAGLAVPRAFFLPATGLSHERPSAPKPGPVALNREDPDGRGPDLYQEALALHEKGLNREAVEKLEGFLSRKKDREATPDMARSMILLARAYADLGRLEEARQWCEKAVAMQKLNPDGYSLLAAIYQEMGLTEEAIRALKRTIYLDPDRMMAYFSLGHLMRLQGKALEAKRFFASARDLLTSMEPDETVPYSDGLTVERLKDAIEMMMDG